MSTAKQFFSVAEGLRFVVVTELRSVLHAFVLGALDLRSYVTEIAVIKVPVALNSVGCRRSFNSFPAKTSVNHEAVKH